MLKRTLALAVVALAAVASGSAIAASKGGTTVTLHKTKLGKVLATSTGMTLYLYTPDPKGKSVCNAGCDSSWPPLTTKLKPRAGTGVNAKLLGTTRRSNGKLQVTYAGHPLYRYVGDTKAGQVSGEGYGGIWYAVSSAGKKVTASSGGGGGGGGYGTGY
jgi:predicted lipoprotein with Yx(FWY)xxD motif